MTAPAKIVAPVPAIERARRGQPVVTRAPASEDQELQVVDVRAWARQVVAVALELEGVELSTLLPPPPETL